MRPPALAIAWEIWHRNRAGSIVVVAALAGAALMGWTVGPASPWTRFAELTGYIILALTLLLAFGCFHFTEGSKKGGFGSFPIRMFTLPVTTSWLVGLPMLYGSAVIILVYLTSALLIFAPLGVMLPIAWPCLHLVFAFTQFQMIIWSFPESRYLKLLFLSFAAASITFSWMFFLPHIIEGTLSAWGYAGDPRLFLRYLFLALTMTGPAAYGLSFYRVHQQRHGKTPLLSSLLDGWEAWTQNLTRAADPPRGRNADRLPRQSTASALADTAVRAPRTRSHHGSWTGIFRLPFRRRKPFRSPSHALFWSEWRSTGSILPISVAAILAITCVPAYLSGPLSSDATVGILIWLFLAPFLLAVIIGRGFIKPDFWDQALNIRPFDAIRPVSAGQWVVTKLKVAWLSVALTWLLVILTSFLLVAHAGNLEGLDHWYGALTMFYGPGARWPLLLLAFTAALILTWKCLISGLATGLSGRKGWYLLSNLLTAFVSLSVIFLVIWRSDHTDHHLHLYDLWGWITWLPAILGSAVLAKMLLALWAWDQVHRREMLSPKSIRGCFLCWALATGCLLALAGVAFPHTAWLRYLLMLLALGVVPLAGPGLAILTLANNRHQAGAEDGWRSLFK